MTCKRILVVDDNADAADAVAVLLSIEGHDVRTAFTAREALRVAASWHPEALVLDIGLPDMDGYELARAVTALGLSPPPRMVALSGYGRPDDIARTLASGIACHLLKPVDPDVLFAAVQDQHAPA